MKFKEVVELVYEGFELGILDNVSFGTSDEQRLVSFFYGGLRSGNHCITIWFDKDGPTGKWYVEKVNELTELVTAAREAGSIFNGFADAVIGEKKTILQEIHEAVCRIEVNMEVANKG